jgi:tetratricopeptide (TPR) repeat protein
VDLEDSFISIPQGSYAMTRENTLLDVEPLYPREGMLTALNVSTVLVFTLSGILTVTSLVDPPSSGRALPLSIITTQATGALLAAASTYMQVDKRRFIEGYPVLQSARAENVLDRDRYERGERYLSEGRMDDALIEFEAVISIGLPSEYYPRSLYQQSRILRFQGNSSQARVGFQEIIENHPLPDLYDKCLKSLADIAFEEGSFDESLTRLSEMVLVDPLFSEEEIASYAAEIIARKFDAGETPASAVMNVYDGLLTRYPSSQQRDYYLIRSARYAALSGDRDKASERIENMSDQGGSYAQEIREVRQLLNGND